MGIKGRTPPSTAREMLASSSDSDSEASDVVGATTQPHAGDGGAALEARAGQSGAGAAAGGRSGSAAKGQLRTKDGK
eukprot:COSAG04_NODE_2432_length_4134_cov_3.602726_1_plen_76_part_10